MLVLGITDMNNDEIADLKDLSLVEKSERWMNVIHQPDKCDNRSLEEEQGRRSERANIWAGFWQE